MKNDFARFVTWCLICQQVKAKHQRPASMLQPLPVTKWKWENVTMDFVTGYQFGLESSSNFIVDVKKREWFLTMYASRIGYYFWPQEHPKLTAFLKSCHWRLVPEFVDAANNDIQNCTFTDNSANQGSAAYLNNSVPKVTGTTVDGSSSLGNAFYR